METTTHAPDQSPVPSKKIQWAGRIVSAVPVVMLVLSSVMKFIQPEPVVEGFEHLGWPTSSAWGLGVVELVSTAIYVIPQTAVLGAILLTGYLGGAIATHVRIGEAFLGPALFGVLVWLGLYLRDPHIRTLLPLR